MTHKTENKIKSLDRSSWGALFSILSAILFGLAPLSAKFAYSSGISSLELSFVRFVTGSILLLAVIKINGKSVRLDRRKFGRLLTVSIFYALMIILLYSSYVYIDSGTATTLHFSYPVFVMLITSFIQRMKPDIRSVLCAAAALVGIALLNNSSDSINSKGVAIAVASGIAYSLYIVLSEWLGIGDIDVQLAAFWISLLSSVYIGTIILFTGFDSFSVSTITVTASTALSITAVLGLIFFQMGMDRCGGVKASLLSTFEPLTSVIVGAIAFGELLTPTNIVGGIMILAASLILAEGK